MKTYFESNRGILRFLKEKMYFRNTLWTVDSITQNYRGSFAKVTGQTGTVNLGRRIESGRWGLEDEEGEEMPNPRLSVLED